MLVNILYVTFWFLVILSVVVFLHELGHYAFARIFGVKVTDFSIGFGKELFGFHDKNGTRWKISALPFGGYVKLYGDHNAYSAPSPELLAMPEEEKKQTLFYKPAWQKLLIVLGGPAANYLTAILIFFGMYTIFGKMNVIPEITAVLVESPAEQSDLRVGDIILEINDKKIRDVVDIRKQLLLSTDSEITITFRRDAEVLETVLEPEIQVIKDKYGNVERMPRIGIETGKVDYIRYSPLKAIGQSFYDCYDFSKLIVITLGQIISGDRSMRELGGPVKIAQYSGRSADEGIFGILLFIAMISINLGFLNLLPIPVLDGGHAVMYIYQILFRREVPFILQKAMMSIGFLFLLALTVFVVFNDIYKIFTGS